jgi:hypothetical protein
MQDAIGTGRGKKGHAAWMRRAVAVGDDRDAQGSVENRNDFMHGDYGHARTMPDVREQRHTGWCISSGRRSVRRN